MRPDLAMVDDSAPKGVSANAEVIEAAGHVAGALRDISASGTGTEFPDDTLQKLFAAVVAIYAAKRDAGQRLTPFGSVELSATEILCTMTELLRSSRLELFELGIYQSWAGSR
jgi:hypothetical protein